MTGWPWLSTPEATRTIDRLVVEARELDREIDARERRARNEAIYLAAVRAWFQRTEPCQ